ncbi:hypothetical protein M441DRAFT_57470 [Trichoderma asperellum CBS 433.97]|uniref:Uncharacterized protein n=1 Tax=Trichoderma asperellum (strain ATCC 204424 / CBS 433.97 / NBRC 101777) TaxID=1042311 RepID=A0A2T3Z919_TRIA4|nr:hypothetical protein M441DRAFT_57470 [Trichoderma asperellum CBS 433.97]PTB41280.1 hypothetical protein M441DRAFT_57470 [Trichoderma asperellum CBS 433.97]
MRWLLLFVRKCETPLGLSVSAPVTGFASPWSLSSHVPVVDLSQKWRARHNNRLQANPEPILRSKVHVVWS